MHKQKKTSLVESYKGILNDASSVVFTRQSGMTVDESEELRGLVRKDGAEYRVIRNKQMRLALQGTSYSGLADELKGPIGITWSKDSVIAARVMATFAKGSQKLRLVCGGVSEKTLNAEELQYLANLPPLEVLRGKIIGMILTPGGRIATTLQMSASRLPRVIKAFSEKTS